MDSYLPLLKSVVDDVSTGIAWPNDIPVVFSGCGMPPNAFFTFPPAETSTHDILRIQGVADPAPLFGPDIKTKNILVMCHELTEQALLTFLLDPQAKYKPEIRRLFASEEEGIILSAAVSELQVLFHEIGHGLDKLLLNDPTNDIRRQNFIVPLPDTCNQAPCDTVSEDFADWISAFVLAEAIKKEAKTSGLAEAKKYAAGLLIASVAFSDVIGPGGDASHGFTTSRHLNLLCYAYGTAFAPDEPRRLASVHIRVRACRRF